MLQRLRSEIKKRSNVYAFADEYGIGRHTLYNFLNGKHDVKLSTLKKVMTPLGFDVLEKLPDTMIEVKCVYIDGKTYKAGEKFEERHIISCFGTAGTSYQGMILDNEGKKEIRIL